MIGVILLLTAGVIVAWAFDNFILARRRPMVKLEGHTLIQVLKNSDQYASIRQNQEVHRARHSDRNIHGRSNVEQLGNAGDGGDVLRLDSRR